MAEGEGSAPARRDAAETDAELTAIKNVISALAGLDSAARSRVVDYVFRRLGLMVPSGQLTETLDSLTEAKVPPGPSRLPLPGVSHRDIRSLRQEKNPKSANEMAAVTAYYLADLAPPRERKEEIGQDDIKKYFKQAGYPLPGKPRMTLVNAKNAGYLDMSAPGLYKLNPVGYNLVVHSLPTPGEGSARAKRRKHQKISANGQKHRGKKS